jgi:peptidoglycan hydrolase CwlO-like protein
MSQRQSEDLHDLQETIGQLEAEIRNLSSELDDAHDEIDSLKMEVANKNAVLDQIEMAARYAQ